VTTFLRVLLYAIRIFVRSSAFIAFPILTPAADVACSQRCLGNDSRVNSVYRVG
jgi:hypothetical protein